MTNRNLVTINVDVPPGAYILLPVESYAALVSKTSPPVGVPKPSRKNDDLPMVDPSIAKAFKDFGFSRQSRGSRIFTRPDGHKFEVRSSPRIRNQNYLTGWIDINSKTVGYGSGNLRKHLSSLILLSRLKG